MKRKCFKMNFLFLLIIIQNLFIFVKTTPTPEQKSLVLVFDTTGSMHDDLVQLRQSAIEITEKLTSEKENPIYNYIFSPFNDPGVGPVVDTKDKHVLLNTLQAIVVYGGGDCPELSMQGIINGISKALPASYVFVFTDASAKDKDRVDEVMSLVQQKQATVSFLVTGFCDNKISDNQIYNKIATNSNGQLFDLQRGTVKIVLDYVKSTLDARNEELFYTSSPVAGSGVIKVNVEDTMEEISIVIGGKTPKVNVIDPDDKISDKAVVAVNLEGVLAAVVKDPAAGLWKFNYSSESAHSVKINALSDLNFKFGFSKTIAKEKEETSFLPLPGENFLTIFPSDPSLVKDLTEVKLSATDIKGSDSESDSGAEIFELSLPLTKYDRYKKVFYKTELFNVPKFQFKLNLLGYDSKGNIINRLLSKTIQPPGELITDKTPPDVTIIPSSLHITEGEDILVKCNAVSMTKIKTDWKKNGVILTSSTTSFSTELTLNKTGSSLADAGQYECISNSKNGPTSATINIQIEKLEFSVKIAETKYVVSAGDELSIPCIVDTTRDFEILWSRNNISLTSWTKGDAATMLYKQANIQKESSGFYGCHVRILNQIKVALTNVIVNYQPIIKEKAIETKLLHFGDYLHLECNADALPLPETYWIFSPKNNPKAIETIASGNKMEIKALSRDSIGDYICEVANGIGTKQKRTITVEVNPAKSPKIIKASSTDVIVQSGSTFELECKCDSCSPLNEYFWNINGTIIDKITNRFKNLEGKRWDILNNFKNATAIYKLKVENAAKDGHYECGLSNVLGKDKITYNVIVHYPPSYIARNTEQDHETRIGEKLYLDCTMNSKPEATYSWYKNGVLLNETANKLSLINIKKDDDGQYTCEAKNYLGSLEVIHYVDVQYKPNIIKISDNLEVLRHTNFSLECVAVGNDLPMLTWIIANKTVLTTSKVQYNNKFLKVLKRGEPIYLDDKNNGYQLKDMNKMNEKNTISGLITVNSKKQQISLILNSKNMTKRWLKETKCEARNKIDFEKKIIKISILDYPKFKELKEENNPKTIDVLEEMPLKLACKSKGEPMPETKWYKDDKLITTNMYHIPMFTDFNHNLIILETSEKDSGKYTCVANNKLGQISYNFIVTIVYPPKQTNNGFIVKTHNKNDNLELDCYADSKPPAEYIWSTLNSVTGEEITLNETSSILKIKDIQSTIKFICVAQNKAGKVETEFQINVKEPPKLLNSENEIYQVEYGSDITLQCKIFDTFPTPTIRWLKDSSDSFTNVIFLSNNESLHIFNTKSSSNGTYTCLVENDLGKVRKIFEVIVEEPKTIWTNWTPYSECSTSCGIGQKYRMRFCTLTNEDKKLCIGNSFEKLECENEPCPIHGGWSEWSDWSSCSATCISYTNAPIKTRTRECNNPAPSIYGNSCENSSTDVVQCTEYDLPKCKIDGGWSNPRTSKCNKKCGNGISKIYRTCTNPKPENGGADCTGNKVLKKNPCKIKDC